MSEDIYKQYIIDRYHQPLHRGNLELVTLKAEEVNSLCGDKIMFQIYIDGNVIMDASWLGEGCAISLAAADMLVDLVKGKTRDEVLGIADNDVFSMLGVELKPSREKCALLCLASVKKALDS